MVISSDKGDDDSPGSDDSNGLLTSQVAQKSSRRLPMELLGEVFVYHASTDWRAPSKLALVCRYWRQTLNETPRAWAYLQISKWDGSHEESLVTWLSRAGNSPLRFRGIRKENLHILPLCINLCALEYRGHASHLNSLEIPSLRFLTLAGDRAFTNHSATDLRRVAPLLNTLDVSNYWDVEELVGEVVASIRELHIDASRGPRIHQTRQILEFFGHNLHTLCVHTNYLLTPRVIVTSSPITLTNLQKLILHWGFFRNKQDTRPVEFINSIKTPQLRVLHEIRAMNLGIIHGMDYTLRSSIKEYIAQNPAEGYSFLQHLSNIEVLKVSYKTPNGVHLPQFKILSELAFDPKACPQVKELEVFIGVEISVNGLKNTVEQNVLAIGERVAKPRIQTSVLVAEKGWDNLELFSPFIDNVSTLNCNGTEY